MGVWLCAHTENASGFVQEEIIRIKHDTLYKYNDLNTFYTKIRPVHK